MNIPLHRFLVITFALIGMTRASAAIVAEAFNTDPVAAGRFIVQTNDTESSFFHNPAASNLTAVLDMDRSSAIYLSAPFAPATPAADASFSFEFRITAIDERVLPSAFVGLLTTNHVNFAGDGLTVALASSNGVPSASAAVDQGPYNSVGTKVRLQVGLEYLAVGRYFAASHQFSVEIFSGTNFAIPLGTSTAAVTNSLDFHLDRLGLQNGGALFADHTNGAITMVVDNLFLPARPPVFLSVTNAGVMELDAGASNNLVFDVRLDSPSVQTVRVDYAVLPGTATAGLDFAPVAGTLTFLPNETLRSLSVVVRGDDLAEPNETLFLVLSNAVNANFVTTQAIGTIRDNDLSRVSISDIAVTEVPGSNVIATFTVSLSNSNSTNVTLNYATTNGTALAGSDYVATNGILTIAPGDTTASIRVIVRGDSLDEADEVFYVNLTNPSPPNAFLTDAQGQCTITNANPPPTLCFDRSPWVTPEGHGLTNLTVSLSLSTVSGKSVTFCYKTMDGSALAGRDYRTTNGCISIAPGQTNGLIPIQILGDRMFELDESFFIIITNITNAVLCQDSDEIFLINDDTQPSVDLSDAGVVEGNAGTTNLMFAFRLSNPSYLEMQVSAVTANGTATANSDYLATNFTIIFPAESTNLTAFGAVPVLGDRQNENDETVMVALTNALNVTLGRIQATGTITNDDFVGVCVSDAALVEGNASTTSMPFSITLLEPSVQPVCVWLTTFDITASSGIDYAGFTNLSVCFLPGATNLIVLVPIFGDVVDEPDERFGLRFERVTNAVLNCQAATGLILDDDEPAVSIISTNVTEGNVGTTNLIFTLVLSSPSTNPITVMCTTSDGSALAGIDYLSATCVVVFPPGVVITNCIVPVLGDTLPETNETFLATLSNPTVATIGTGQGVGTIIDDDFQPEVLWPTNIILVEGTCTNITGVLTHTSAVPVRVWLCLSNAPAGSRLSCGANCCTNIVPAGSSIVQFQICADDNNYDELDFEFGFTGGRERGQIGGGRIRYIDNDPPTLVVSNAGVVEGHSGTTNLCFNLRLSSVPTNDVYVDFETREASAGSSDFIAANGTIHIPAGTTNGQLCISINGDCSHETNEHFLVWFTNAVHAILATNLVRGWITNDDLPPVISVNSNAVVEGDDGTTSLIFTVSLSCPSGLEVNLGFRTTNGTATGGVDYVPINGILRFAPDTPSLAVPVQVIGDRIDEPTETLFLRLSSPTNGTLGNTNGVGTILDDDPIEIRVVGTNVVEGDTGATNVLAFVISLSTSATNQISVDYFTTDGTAQQGLDYTRTNGTVTFSPNETNKIVPVRILGDDDPELDETMRLCLTNASSGILSVSCASGIIRDDDAPCVSISNAMVTEPLTGTTTMVFAVTLNGPSPFPISVSFASSNGTAFAGVTNDYIGGSGRLDFPPGLTATSLVFTVLADLFVESNETFTVQLTLSTNANATLCTNVATGLIRDSTIPPIITVTSAAQVEGTAADMNLIFIARLNRASPQVVSFDYTTANGSAVSNLDYRARSGRITFPPNVVATNIVVPVLADCRQEGDEMFIVRLTNALFAILASNEVTGTVLDDDPAPTLGIDNPVVRERDLETVNLIFHLSLPCASAFTNSVHFATVDGTAMAFADYTPTNGIVTFQPGVTSNQVVVTVLADLLAESDEIVYLELSDVQGLLLPANRATGTILDDDTITIRIDPAVALEGFTNRFTVTLSKPPSSELTVAYATVDDTAMAPADYMATNGTLHFPASNTVQTISVIHRSDAVDEPIDEYYWVGLSSPSRGTFETNKALGTILDGDPPCLSVNDIVVIDDGSPRLTGTFVVSLSSTSSLPVSFAYFTRDGTALDPTDYTGRSGVTNIPPGSIRVLIPIEIKVNTLDETNEFFYLFVTNAVNARYCDPVGICTIATGTNAPPTATLSLAPPGDCFTLPTNILLRASASDSDGIVTRVRFYADTNLIGEAASLPYEVTWSPAKAGDFRLAAVAQDNFGDLSTSAPVRISLRWPATNRLSDTVVLEGNSMTNLDFVLRLDGPSCQTVSVQAFTVDGTAMAVSDYHSIALTNIVFSPGDTSAVVRVRIIGDLVKEPDELFYLVLTNPVNVTLTQQRATGTILNDDTNIGPSVVITNPINGQVFLAPTGIIPILANAVDPDGFITEVQFFVDGTFLSRATNGTNVANWPNPGPGDYALSAIATDNLGARATSATVRVSVRCDTLVATPLANQTRCVCDEVTFATTISSCAPVTIAWKANGILLPGETNRTLHLRNLHQESAGLYAVEVTSPFGRVTQSATLTLKGAGNQNPVSFMNTNRITIIDHVAASPYPSLIQVDCVPGPIKHLSVTLSNLSHNFPDDIEIMLVSPAGPAVRLMSDTGGGGNITNLSLTFTDTATALLPDQNTLVSGTYAPTDYEADPDIFPSPAPLGVIGTGFAPFLRTTPNGAWALFVHDDLGGDAGSIASGWRLTIDWEDTPPYLSGPRYLSDGSFQATLIGLDNMTHIVETSVDLIHWVPVLTKVLNGPWLFTIPPTAATTPYRFFRAIRCPSSEPRLSEPEYLGSGRFRANLHSIPGYHLAIEATTDLIRWVRVATNTMDSPVMRIEIPGASTTRQQFFRAVIIP